MRSRRRKYSTTSSNTTVGSKSSRAATSISVARRRAASRTPARRTRASTGSIPTPSCPTRWRRSKAWKFSTAPQARSTALVSGRNFQLHLETGDRRAARRGDAGLRRQRLAHRTCRGQRRLADGAIGYRLNALTENGQSYVVGSDVKRDLVSGNFDFHLDPPHKAGAQRLLLSRRRAGVPAAFVYGASPGKATVRARSDRQSARRARSNQARLWGDRRARRCRPPSLTPS